MKFHWFAEVTYPHLPDDFRERYDSAWVTPPAHLCDPIKAGETYKMFIRLMQLADQVGFDGLTVNEHHQTVIAMTPSPNLLAASLASTTENATIVIVGNSLALYNPPTRVAEEYAYLDWSIGRPSDRRDSSSARQWIRCSPTESRRPRCASVSRKRVN